MADTVILEGEVAPGAPCNRRRKLVALVHPDTAEIIGVIETYKLHPPKVVERVARDEAGKLHRQMVRCRGIEVDWAGVPVGFNQELPDGRQLVPVAIVSCDGSSKLPGRRIGTGDGLPPECKLEACLEVSNGVGPVRTDDGRTVAQTRGDFRGPPVVNTLRQARELVAELRAQEFPTRRIHNPARDHHRPPHCVGRLVRCTPAERAAGARAMIRDTEASVAAGTVNARAADRLAKLTTLIQELET